MKRFINILILIVSTSFISIVTRSGSNFQCIFKSLFGFCCPGCGLTRAFRAIYSLDFYSAFKYNILGIPLFIFANITFISLIIDIIKNDNKTIRFINILLEKYYICFILLVAITMIINNINGI